MTTEQPPAAPPGDLRRNIKLLIEYDGTNFRGWQAQPDARTVQGALEQAVLQVTGERVRTHGAGRTDAGVHAVGQVANFLTRSTIPGARFARALTRQLPDDVVVRSSQEVPPDFHARHSATGRVYGYRILCREMRAPLLRFRAWQVPWALDAARMRAGARALIGEHDFRAFAAGLEPDEVTVRELRRIEIEECGGELVLTFEARSFLRRMVRMVTGTLVEIGRGKWAPERSAEILAARENRLSGAAAPAHGLTLQEAFY